MRVISGSARGRSLSAPRGERIRPTSDRVKEALFSILISMTGSLAGLRVLDIFAGTGNLGIEALSRGCESAVFVDNHRESAAIIQKNLKQLNLSGQGRIIMKDAVAALLSLEKEERPFHLVFLDPPYRTGMTERVLTHIARSGLIDSNSTVVAEFAATENIPTSFGPLLEFDRRIYGDTALAFLKKES